MFLQVLAVSVLVFWISRWFLRRLKIRHYGNKHVFITGCDTGFGNLLAKRLDKLGFRVFAGCLTEQGVKELKSTCSRQLVTIEIDVSKETSIANARKLVEQKLPKDKGLWAIVNNAGISGPVCPIEWTSSAEFRKVMEINLFGVIFVTKEFLPLVRKERGRVVNIASIMARFAMATGPYAASKFGVEGFSDQLRRELYRTGVTVHILEPGYFRTSIVNEEILVKDLQSQFEAAPKEVQTYYGESFRDEMAEKTSRLLSTVMSPKVHMVVDAYEHAITARFPKARYVVGWDAQIMFRLLWNLPEWLSDYLVTRPMATPEGARL